MLSFSCEGKSTFGLLSQLQPYIKTPQHFISSLLYSVCTFSHGIYKGLKVISLLQILLAHNCPKEEEADGNALVN